MSEELKADDLGAAWRGQPDEERTVKMEDFVSRRTRELRSSSRSETVMSIGAALFFLVVVPWRLAAEMGRVPVVGLIAAVVWVLISLYWFRDRIWRKEPARDALAAPGLEYYRCELERRRDHLRNAWLWHGPLIVACVFFVAIVAGRAYPGVERLRSVLPLVALLVVWTAYGIHRRRRQANALQVEIDEIGR